MRGLVKLLQQKYTLKIKNHYWYMAQILQFTPQKPPYGEYIKAIESACQSLDPNSAKELRSDVYNVLRHPCQLKTNLRKEEITAIKQLKADKERIIQTADKGIALVVMDRSDYIKKANELLQDLNTYRTI